MQTDVITTTVSHFCLQELPIRIELDGEQVGHLKDALLLAEILADTLLLGERIGHFCHL